MGFLLKFSKMVTAFSRASMLFLFTILFSFVKGQGFKIEEWSLKDGLSNNVVKDIHQDKNGLMWFATEHGLNSFDGHKFEVFRSNPFDKKAIGANFLTSIFEDPDGNIWAALSVGGVSKLDQKSKSFITYKSKSKNPKNREIKSMFWDREGNIWLGTDLGLNFLDLKSRQYHLINKPFFRGTIQEIGQTKKDILSLKCDQRNYQLNWKTKEIKEVEKKNVPVINSFQGISLRRLDRENQGHSWYVDQEGSLYYQFRQDSLQKVLDHFISPIKQQNIENYLVDCSGGLWLSKHGEGLCRIHPKIYDLGLFNPVNQFFASSNINAFITAICEDSQQNLWIGTAKGLYLFDSTLHISKKINLDFLNAIYILEIIEDGGGDIWIATNRGLFKINSKTKIKQQYLPESGNRNSLSSQFVRGLYEDWEGRLWVATGSGLNLYQEKTDNFIRFYKQDHPNSLNGNDVRKILQTSENEYWIGYVRNGISSMQFNSQANSIKCQSYPLENGLPPRALVTVNDLFLDRKKNLWVGTYSKGLLIIDTIEEKLKFPFSGKNLIPNVSGIMEDKGGNLWLGSNNGIYKIKGGTKEILYFGDPEELQSRQFNIGAFEKKQSGHLIFGGINGINLFDPSSVKLQVELNPPRITAVYPFGEITPSNLLRDHEEILNLDYKENSISIHFISYNYQNNKSLKYSYKLEGMFEDWIEVEDQLAATFTNLPGGNYRFILKARDQLGNWNPNIAELKIMVRPPFYKTAFFYVLASLMLLFLGLLVYRLRWYLKLKQLKNIEKIRERAAADFHDELGHRLTKISLFAETLFSMNPNMEQSSFVYLSKIKDNTAELYHSMKDFIWAMNPRNDNLLELAILLKDFGDELFSNTEISFKAIGIHEGLSDIKLNMDWKRNIVLLFKEAAHNALKHSQCKELILSFSTFNGLLNILLKDDGKGFLHNPGNRGYGLINMRERAKRLNAELIIQSAPEQGTEISFSIQINQNINKWGSKLG